MPASAVSAAAQKLLGGYGKTISQENLQDFLSKGFSTQEAIDYAVKNSSANIGFDVKTPMPAKPGSGKPSAAATAAATGANSVTPFDTMSQATYDWEKLSGITNLQGNIQKELEILRNSGAENIANISAGAQRFGYEADERARKYVADRAGQSAEAVENIRSKGNLDLQAIVNAGLKDVAGIQGETARDVEKTRGEYGVKEEETRQSGGRDIARLAGKAGIYQGLVGAFNF